MLNKRDLIGKALSGAAALGLANVSKSPFPPPPSQTTPDYNTRPINYTYKPDPPSQPSQAWLDFSSYIHQEQQLSHQIRQNKIRSTLRIRSMSQAAKDYYIRKTEIEQETTWELLQRKLINWTEPK